MNGKRITALLGAVAVLFALMGCSAVSLGQTKTELYASGGMEIVLPKGFTEHTVDGYTVCYDSASAEVFALREPFSLAEGVEDMTVDEYADLVRTANVDKSPSSITVEEGFPMMEYTYYVESHEEDFVYLSVMYKAQDAFWTLQFVCSAEDYEEYRPQFIEWAKSVKFVPAE